MWNPGHWLALAAVLAFAPPLSGGGLPGGRQIPGGGQVGPPPRHPCRASLVRSVQTIAAGQPFEVGIHLRLDPGWHIYWHSPRDGGQRTAVEWSLPPGYRLVNLQYPVPERFVETGDIVSYGYSREALISCTIAPPAEGRGSLDAVARCVAEVSWLVCRGDCYPGVAKLELELPVGPSAVADDVGAAQLARWADRFPRPAPDPREITLEQSWRELDPTRGLWRISWRLEGGGPRAGTLRVFPFDPPQARLSEAPLQIDGAGAAVTVEFPVRIGGEGFRPRDLGALFTFELEAPAGGEPASGAATRRSKRGAARAFEVRYRGEVPGEAAGAGRR